MSVSPEQSVREIAATHPNAARIFEMFGIDACCNADVPIAEGAAHAGIAVDEVLDLLSGNWSQVRPADGALRWTLAPLAELIAEVVQGHHRYTRSRLVYFDSALRILSSGHTRTQTHLLKLRTSVDHLIDVLVPHMRYEEQVIFPYMRCLEKLVVPDEHAASGAPPQPEPLQSMTHDHTADVALVDDLRRVTNDYAAPAGACESERTLYRELAEFDLDLRQHIHLENDVLFRRAAEMEWIAHSHTP